MRLPLPSCARILAVTSAAGSSVTLPSMAMIMSFGFLGSGPWKVNDRSRTSVPGGRGIRLGLLDQLLPGSSGPAGNAGGLCLADHVLERLLGKRLLLACIFGQAVAQLLERRLGNLDVLDLAAGFHLEREFSAQGRLQLPDLASNGSGIELFGELESNSNGMNGGASTFIVNRSIRCVMSASPVSETP